jgi:hypothetical protein
LHRIGEEPAEKLVVVAKGGAVGEKEEVGVETRRLRPGIQANLPDNKIRLEKIRMAGEV